MGELVQGQDHIIDHGCPGEVFARVGQVVGVLDVVIGGRVAVVAVKIVVEYRSPCGCCKLCRFGIAGGGLFSSARRSSWRRSISQAICEPFWLRLDDGIHSLGWRRRPRCFLRHVGRQAPPGGTGYLGQRVGRDCWTGAPSTGPTATNTRGGLLPAKIAFGKSGNSEGLPEVLDSLQLPFNAW